MRFSSLGCAVGVVVAFCVEANGQLVRVTRPDFLHAAYQIDLEAAGEWTPNPVFEMETDAFGTMSMAFGGYFVGQTPSLSFPITLSGSPAGPLVLAGEDFAYASAVTARPLDWMAVVGYPYYIGPISVLFSKPVAAFAVYAGDFERDTGTQLLAFDQDGNLLGSTTNRRSESQSVENVRGYEFFGLADAQGRNLISGFTLVSDGTEVGFGIYGLTFASRSELAAFSEPNPGLTPVPEPATYGGMGAAFLTVIVCWRARRDKWRRTKAA